MDGETEELEKRDRSFGKAEVGELVELGCTGQMVGAVSVKRGVDVTSEVEHDGFDGGVGTTVTSSVCVDC